MSDDKFMSIVVLSWNRPHYTKQTIECLMERTTTPHELILVDNFSAEETGVREYLRSVNGNEHTKDIKLVFNSRNLGVSGGRDEGLHISSGDIIFHIDDDILVPVNYDKMFRAACEKIPKLGIIGISVEKPKYPKVTINGVDVRVKKQGNINGAAIAFPRRTFKRIGYWGLGRGTIYGHDDSKLKYALDIIGLCGYYIPPKGVHLDEDKDLGYRKAKNAAHVRKSIQLQELSRTVSKMRETGNVYTPYTPPEDYHPVDEHIFTNDLIMKDRGKV